MRLIYRCMCLVLGAILGTGCNDPGDVAEYGMPFALLKVDGRVVDRDGAPIPDVAVTLSGASARADTTDAAGQWGFDLMVDGTPCTDGCQAVATDIDGPDHGGPYPPAAVPLDLTQTEAGSGWNQGTWEQHGLDLVMDDAAEYGPPPAPRRP